MATGTVQDEGSKTFEEKHLTGGISSSILGLGMHSMENLTNTLQNLDQTLKDCHQHPMIPFEDFLSQELEEYYEDFA